MAAYEPTLSGHQNLVVSDASRFVTGTVVPVDGGFAAFSGAQCEHIMNWFRLSFVVVSFQAVWETDMINFKEQMMAVGWNGWPLSGWQYSLPPVLFCSSLSSYSSTIVKTSGMVHGCR